MVLPIWSLILISSPRVSYYSPTPLIVSTPKKSHHLPNCNILVAVLRCQRKLKCNLGPSSESMGWYLHNAHGEIRESGSLSRSLFLLSFPPPPPPSLLPPFLRSVARTTAQETGRAETRNEDETLVARWVHMRCNVFKSKYLLYDLCFNASDYAHVLLPLLYCTKTKS